MRWFVDAWDPGYGTSFDGDGGSGPTSRSTAEVDVAVERPAEAWQPLAAPPDLRAPDVVLLVDGVRRNDAGLWTAEDDGTSYAGLAASYAAGVVRCDLRAGAAALAGARVARGLFTASPSAEGPVLAGQVRYPVCRVGNPDPQSLAAAVQPQLTALEVEVSAEARASGDELLVVDGPLRNRRQLPRTIGYVKTQQSQYLPAALAAVVTALRPGQRSPVFRLGTRWHAYTWYLRLPGRPGAPWAGIVRVECSVDWPVAEAVALADVSAVTLPRFASTPYKDPRAPQNLVPIAGLERRLRGLLGDPRLLHRALTIGTSRAAALV
jgi:hypothetical protein